MLVRLDNRALDETTREQVHINMDSTKLLAAINGKMSPK